MPDPRIFGYGRMDFTVKDAFAAILSVDGKRKYLPFCVRTGAPEVRVPATDKALASVDMIRIEGAICVRQNKSVRDERKKTGMFNTQKTARGLLFVYLFENDLTFVKYRES